ncbi:MAG TPA: exodeoxyribonuclease VII large subunit, partial [Oscillospiraceae bacterium]|nr:exodeoxyribonuclease VII large subunit [Oscillospiraceae bacterium]
LKEKLSKEGLFAPEHKRPIPRYPQKIGVITSRSGAALHDIEKILERRWPLGEILLYPVSVQGAESVPQIVRAIEAMNRACAADVLLLGRGGGSADDLSVFNDERIARAVYASTIPVISAVGHETDFAICDFVADLRAPTPSAAAELCSPDGAELKYYFDSVSTALTAKIRALLEHDKEEKIERNAEKLNSFTSVALATGSGFIRERRDALGLSIGRLTDRLDRVLEREITRLDGANPAKILKKGFCFAEKEGRPVRSSGELGPGDEVRLRFSDGAVGAKII